MVLSMSSGDVWSSVRLLARFRRVDAWADSRVPSAVDSGEGDHRSLDGWATALFVSYDRPEDRVDDGADDTGLCISRSSCSGSPMPSRGRRACRAPTVRARQRPETRAPAPASS